jgi:replication factor C subunit 3/5
LRKVIEKYVNNVRFCFVCNYLKKINPAIQSRCIIFRFKPIPEENMHNFIVDVCTKEKIKIKTNAIKLIIKRSNGDMRKLLNILQSIYMYMHSIELPFDINNKTNMSKIQIEQLENNLDISNYLIINENSVSKILSCPTDKNIKKILKFIQENELSKSYGYILDIINTDGISLVELISCIYEYFMDNIINNDNTIIKYDILKSVEIIKKMSIINENLSYCNSDNMQIISFLSIFYLE